MTKSRQRVLRAFLAKELAKPERVSASFEPEAGGALHRTQTSAPSSISQCTASIEVRENDAGAN
jgi:hypothetical protein